MYLYMAALPQCGRTAAKLKSLMSTSELHSSCGVSTRAAVVCPHEQLVQREQLSCGSRFSTGRLLGIEDFTRVDGSRRATVAF